MGIKKNKLNALIFIDTNIFLDFYRNRKSDISLNFLKRIVENKDKIITSNQVEMEFKKNRQFVLLESINNVKKINNNEQEIPIILTQTNVAKQIITKKKSISILQSRLKDKIDLIFKNPVYNDPVYQSLQKLFKNNSEINLNRTNKLRFTIRNLAKKRFILGYPPKKAKDNSIGDAINWEWIIHCAFKSQKDIIIVSRDSDYGVTYNNEQFLNDWLKQEFKQRVSQKRQIILTNKLNVAFKLISVPITKAMEIEEEKYIESTSLDAIDS
jgi:hypothetical protein